ERDVGAAAVEAAGDLGRRQLGTRAPPRAQPRRRVASVSRLRPGSRPSREGAVPGIAHDSAHRAAERRRDDRRRRRRSGCAVPGRADDARVRAPLPRMSDEFVLDTTELHGFVDDVRATIAATASPEQACEALWPRFAELLADPGWLPTAYQADAPE